MNSSKGIIDKIVSTNQAVIDNNIAEAEAKAREIIGGAEKKRAERLAEYESGRQAIYDETVRRRVSVATLDAKREVMNARRAAVDKVFAESVRECFALDKSRYLDIIEGMIIANAEDGDTVIVCEADAKRINTRFINSIAKKMGITLHLSKEYGSFLGGVILSSNRYDKNLTLEMEIAALRQQVEAEYLTKLFKE